jgi:hypothetical protein
VTLKPVERVTKRGRKEKIKSGSHGNSESASLFLGEECHFVGRFLGLALSFF